MSLADVLHFHLLWQDTNPPAYRILLGIWTAFVGPTPFGGRAFGAFLGLLAVPLTYRVGRVLRIDRWAASLGSFFVSLSPMEVFYSRELKHYPFVQLFLLLMIWGWLHLFDGPFQPDRRHSAERRSLLAIAAVFTLSGALAVGTHYMAALVLVVLDAWTLAWIVLRARSGWSLRDEAARLGTWFGAQVLAGLIILPWFLTSAAGAVTGAYTTGEGQGSVTLPPLEFLTSQLVTFSAGPVGINWQRFALTGVILAMATAGVLNVRSRRESTLFLSVWLVGPVLIGMVVQTTIPFFPPRFLIIVIPALALLVGQGVVNIWLARKHANSSLVIAVPIALIVALSGFLLRAQFHEAQPTPDLRPLADDLQDSVSEGDALIYSYSWQPGMVAAYLAPGVQPTYYASFFPAGELESSMEQILKQHRRVWLLTYEIGADNPINDVGLWLLRHAATPGGSWYEESQLTLFLDPGLESSTALSVSCVDTSDQRLALCYHPLHGSGIAGQPLVIDLQWQVRAEIEARYIVFVHLVGPETPIPAAQQDSEPVNGQSPTFSWKVGQTIYDPHAVILPSSPQNASTTYEIYAGLYDADTLDRVLLDDGADSVPVGQVTVRAP